MSNYLVGIILLLTFTVTVSKAKSKGQNLFSDQKFFLAGEHSSLEYPNQIVGPPLVECYADRITLKVKTSNGNPSDLFVRGRRSDPNCVTINYDSITINHENCGLKRERTVNPAGVAYRMCVVVQLHPLFITEVDRTFCPRCFYREATKEIEQELEVRLSAASDRLWYKLLDNGMQGPIILAFAVPKNEVSVRVPMPDCTYTIRDGSPTGPEVRFAVVGQPVFHVWSCPSDVYGMAVQDCYVDDGEGDRIQLISKRGCGVDTYIIDTPTYSTDRNTAFQESHVFQFADKTVTRFSCTIELCTKSGDGCAGITPPNCQNADTEGKNTGVKSPTVFVPSLRKTRSVEEPERIQSVQISTEIFVFESPDQIDWTNYGGDSSLMKHRTTIQPPDAILCFSNLNFAILLICLAITLFSVSTVSALLLYNTTAAHSEFCSENYSENFAEQYSDDFVESCYGLSTVSLDDGPFSEYWSETLSRKSIFFESVSLRRFREMVLRRFDQLKTGLLS